jgi:hypothetical protein
LMPIIINTNFGFCAAIISRAAGGDPEAFETWRSIANDDEQNTFRGALANVLSARFRSINRDPSSGHRDERCRIAP